MSASLVGFHVLYSFFDLQVLGDLKEMIIVGFQISRDSFYEQEIVSNFEMVPVIMFWLLIGIMAYFLYFSLLVVYYNLEQLIVRELFFTKAKLGKDDSRTTKMLKRIYVHAFVIFAYLASFLLISFAIFPLLDRGRSIIQNLIGNYIISDYALGASLVLLFIAWFIVISLFIFLFRKLRDILWNEKLEEEHRDV
jgi:hypothetical protein